MGRDSSVSSAVSAISLSGLNFRPPSRRSYFPQNNRINSYSSAQETIERLLPYSNKLVSDACVRAHIEQLKSQILFLDNEARHLLREYLKNTVCPTLGIQGSDTVASYLCGCFLSLDKYNSLKPGCSLKCASSPFSDGHCDRKVVQWVRDPLTGNVQSKVISGVGVNCNIFMDGSLQISDADRLNLLKEANCENVVYYNAETNTPIVNYVVRTTPAQAPPAVTQPTTIPTVQPVQGGGVRTWVIVILILFLLLLLIVAFFMWRYMARRD